MKPVAFLPPYVWLFWIVFLAAYLPEFRLVLRSRPQPGESTDRGSMNLILLAGWIAFPFAFYIPHTGRFNLAHPKVWFFTGLAVLICGSLLRRYCWRVLGRYFTGNVKIQEGQTVIQDGPYRWIRHPSYTGGMMMYFGSGLALANWMSAFVLLAASAAGYLYRVHVEEKALVSGLGESYRQYMQCTKRFVPFVI
jgi:protein-S-isoprenylcysteine O-methyltransferase Ste14